MLNYEVTDTTLRFEHQLEFVHPRYKEFRVDAMLNLSTPKNKEEWYKVFLSAMVGYKRPKHETYFYVKKHRGDYMYDRFNYRAHVELILNENGIHTLIVDIQNVDRKHMTYVKEALISVISKTFIARTITETAQSVLIIQDRKAA